MGLAQSGESELQNRCWFPSKSVPQRVVSTMAADWGVGRWKLSGCSHPEAPHFHDWKEDASVPESVYIPGDVFIPQVRTWTKLWTFFCEDHFRVNRKVCTWFCPPTQEKRDNPPNLIQQSGSLRSEGSGRRMLFFWESPMSTFHCWKRGNPKCRFLPMQEGSK